MGRLAIIKVLSRDSWKCNYLISIEKIKEEELYERY